ncbi:MAG: ion channel [bacterium]|nr:ion channel [bacterium]
MGSESQERRLRMRVGKVRAEDVLTVGGRMLKRRLAVPVLIAAVGVIPLLIFEEWISRGSGSPWLVAANWVIWGVFAIELAMMLVVTPRRPAYLRYAWLDVVIVVVTFPLLPHLMAALRLARLARLLPALQLLRLAVVVNHLRLAVGRVFGTAGVQYVLAVLVALVIGGGALFSHLEGVHSVPDGIWWAIVTSTSVGYGDVVPTSWSGRALATVLMVVGLGFVALFTAAIAARIVDAEDDREHEAVMRKLKEQQAENAEIKAQLRELTEAVKRL